MERTTDSLTCDKLCRLCLSTRGETLPIFSSGSSSDESDPPLLASKIHACVSVEISEDDALPTQICKKCVSNVNNWHIFKRICDESQVKLQSWINDGAEISQLGLKIKKEPSPEDDDDIVIDASYPGVEMVEGGEIKLQPEGPPILASLGLAPRNEKSCADPRTDWNRIVAIQNLVERDEPVEATDSADDDDFLQESEVDSDSDQELEPSEGRENKSEYVSKDGYLKWYKKPVKTSQLDSLKRKTISGTTGAASGVQTPLQAWSCLFTEKMLDAIVDHTNEYIEKNYVLADFIGQSNENLITRVELKALLGILYLSGVMRPAYYNHAELWWADGCGLSAVQNAMPLDRFRFILKCLRFDEPENCNARSSADPVAPVRRMFDDFNANCRQSYNIGRCAVIDEKIEPFKGRCPFRKSLKTRSTTKSGIKMFCVVEADTFYTSNMEIAVVRNSSHPTTQTNLLNGTIERLVGHLANSGVTLVARPRLANLSLAKRITDGMGMNFVGALRASRKEIPAAFVSQLRKSYSSLFGYSEDGCTLMSYLHPKRRACVLLSTRDDHHNSRKLHHNGAPQALVWYKQRRGAAQAAAVLAGSYTCAKRCPRWPLALFLSLLDVAAVNSQVLWLSNRPQADVIYRRNFVRSLALELIGELLRSSSERGSGADLDPLLAIRGGPVNNAATADASVRKSKRCKLCPRNADRKTRIYCIACSAPICKEHYRQLCVCCALKF